MKWRNGTTVTEQDTVHVTSTSMKGTVGLKLKVPGITILHVPVERQKEVTRMKSTYESEYGRCDGD